jgi:altronate dehydratase
MPQAMALVLDAADNVAVALDEIAPGTELHLPTGETIVAAELIPFAHKIARSTIAAGGAVLKYGVPIAFATRAIDTGEWVHEHNSKSYFVAKREVQAG